MAAHLGREKLHFTASARLGLVQRHFGVALQGLGVGAVFGVHGNANTGADVEGIPLEGKRFRQFVDDALDDEVDRRHLRARLDDDVELVGTDPGDGLDLRQHGAQSLAGFLQNLIAGLVAEAFVDRREIVEIDEGEREARSAHLGRLHRIRQKFAEERTVRQAGQRIAVDEEVEPLLGVAAFGNVAMRTAHAKASPFGIEHRFADVLDPALAPLARADAEDDRSALTLGCRRSVCTPCRQVIGVDDLLHQRRVGEEVLGRVAGYIGTGRRNVEEGAIRRGPVLPVR